VVVASMTTNYLHNSVDHDWTTASASLLKE
jgi:hypothetical protein